MTVLAYYSYFLPQTQKDEGSTEGYSVLHNSYYNYFSTTTVDLNYGPDPIMRYYKCLNTKDTEPNVIINNLVKRKDTKFVKEDQAGSECLSFSPGTFHNSKLRSCFL